MLIGGLQKSSLIDYPGKIAAVIFTQGCNFRCPYCHNPELVNGERGTINGKCHEMAVLEFLKKRIGKLDGVVITGGEPTLHNNLPEFIKQIKNLGFAIKLDTNGTNPEMLKQLIDEKLIDYVAMDIKAPLDKYSEIVCTKVDTDKILKSIGILKNSNIKDYCTSPFFAKMPLSRVFPRLVSKRRKSVIFRRFSLLQGRPLTSLKIINFGLVQRTPFKYEFRTTVVKSQLSRADFEKIGALIQSAPKYYLQRFLPTKTLDESFLTKVTYSDEEFTPIINLLKEYIQSVELR